MNAGRETKGTTSAPAAALTMRLRCSFCARESRRSARPFCTMQARPWWACTAYHNSHRPPGTAELNGQIVVLPLAAWSCRKGNDRRRKWQSSRSTVCISQCHAASRSEHTIHISSSRPIVIQTWCREHAGSDRNWQRRCRKRDGPSSRDGPKLW